MILKHFSSKSRTSHWQAVLATQKGKTRDRNGKGRKMNELINAGKDFIGYEYKNVTVRRNSADLYADSFPSFGWSLEGMSVPIGGVNSVTMKFKRDRKIHNKAELTRLQRQFEAQVAEVECLEASKGMGASAAAYIIGIIGTAAMAGSVFAYLANMIILSIALAVPAFIAWAITYFCYKNIRNRKTERVTPIIDGKYDEIYEVCEKANSLLAY